MMKIGVRRVDHQGLGGLARRALWRGSVVLWLSAHMLSAHAETAEADSQGGPPHWTGDSELGFVLTGGNTETQTIHGKLSLFRDYLLWRPSVKLETLNSSEDNDTTAEKYLGQLKIDYKLDSVDTLFSSATYEDDRSNGFDYQNTLTFGYGRTLFQSSLHHLMVEFGPGYRYSKRDNGTSTEEGILSVLSRYAWHLSPSASFNQELSSNVGDDEVITKSVSSIKAQIVGRLAMKCAFTLRHTDAPLSGFESTDTETALTFVYSY